MRVSCHSKVEKGRCLITQNKTLRSFLPLSQQKSNVWSSRNTWNKHPVEMNNQLIQSQSKEVIPATYLSRFFQESTSNLAGDWLLNLSLNQKKYRLPEENSQQNSSSDTAAAASWSISLLIMNGAGVQALTRPLQLLFSFTLPPTASFGSNVARKGQSGPKQGYK